MIASPSGSVAAIVVWIPVALQPIVVIIPDAVVQVGFALILNASSKIPDNPEAFAIFTSYGSFAFDTEPCTLDVI